MPPILTPKDPRLLIVDDDQVIADTLSFILGNDFSVRVAASRSEAIEVVRGMEAPPDIALIDLGLPPLPHRPDEGFALIGELLAHAPDVRIIVLSGQDEEANARHARALGATDFLAKPADPDQLRQRLLDALAMRLPTETANEADADCHLIGNSLPVQKLRTQLRQYADSPFPVLIEGESGSGKEVIASCCLHQHSIRRKRPFLALNCAAISPSLVEPTLFGYARGAFTGAVQQKSGYFEDADDGTLFLDEIGELPLDLQAKLLRVLENGQFQRVGETQTRTSRARVIAATNRDLRQEVREGRFRADLYHRLSVFSVVTPPLREMGADKLLLLNHFRTLYTQQSGTAAFALNPEAQRAWLEYPFPGNVRELRNIVIRLCAKHPGEGVSVDMLQNEFDIVATGPANPDTLISLAMQDLQRNPLFSLDEVLRRWEKAYIDAAQQITRGNVSQTARLLGINRTTLYSRLENLSRPKG